MESTKSYKISLIGCDDTTRFQMELSDEEVILLKKVAKKSIETSYYNCMPKMEIDESEESEEVKGDFVDGIYIP